MSDSLDPSRCPLCGQSNQCGQCDPADAPQPCWCFRTTIVEAARERIPAPAKNRACLCPRCARGELPAQP